MFEKLITSRARSKILELFLSEPELEIHMREIARRIDENINSARRELNHLEDMGLLDSRMDGNQRYFRINKDHPIYPELKNIYLKTSGVGNAIRGSLSELGDIDFCFIYGSYASHSEKPDSDLDLFIVGEIGESKLIPVINGLEKKLSRDINYILYTSEEFRKRKERGDKFIMNVLEGEKIMLIGDWNDL